jgi:hypothetical protein
MKLKKILNMTRFLISICLLLVVSCVPDNQPKPSVKPAQKTDVFTVFLTGNELGALKPCGCSGGQLGGLDRRWDVLSSVPRQKKLVVDTGSLIESDREQDLIKFGILIQAFSLLDYDLVNLTEKDYEIAHTLGLLRNPVVGFISSHSTGESISAKFANQYLLQDEPFILAVAAFDAKTARIEQIKELFPPRTSLQAVNILILSHCDTTTIDSIINMVRDVDCLVCPSESDEPSVIGDYNKRPLVISVGRFGRYVCRLDIKAAKNKERLDLSFHSIPVVEDFRQGPSLVRLYKDYQQLVKESNLLEKYPRFILPNDLKYVGSETCKRCHDYEYEKWSSKAHAHAYATLEKAGTQYDPECVVCHVVGMEYESGFISEEKTSHLKDVGCENCHGPGSEHVRTLGVVEPGQTRSSCVDCHTPENSGEYAGNEQLYLEKIRHWSR